MTISKRVLVIEDEDEIRSGVCRWLQYAGFTTLTAEDGKAGVEVATRELPDAIVLDVLMPKKDGMQVLRELREVEDTSSTPVVMLSASLRDEKRALDAGARFFVTKPYDGRQVISAVQVAIAGLATEAVRNSKTDSRSGRARPLSLLSPTGTSNQAASDELLPILG